MAVAVMVRVVVGVEEAGNLLINGATGTHGCSATRARATGTWLTGALPIELHAIHADSWVTKHTVAPTTTAANDDTGLAHGAFDL